jgi:hypothetical protein
MKTNTKLTIAAAALTGLLAGAASRASAATTPINGEPGSKLVVAAGHHVINLDDTDKNACKGQNACKGKGGCKTGDNGCKGKNSCKGKGGCKTNGDAAPDAPKML